MAETRPGDRADTRTPGALSRLDSPCIRLRATAMSTTIPLPPPAADPTAPDEALVDRVLGGDVQAFELLMRRNNQRLYRAIRSLVSDEEEVEELMQQAYVLAFTRLQQFARGARFSTWLLRIGLNEALQRLRRDRRWPQVAPEVLEEEPSMHATPEQ